ncbi:MAG: hypothetical protein N5P05_002715 [Chroococcopsis gigantea SAG 12.99]|jgi:hypothetical protein|nr:hypothetical protein [Chroococcopsis gigantea SAG 12.99]
MIAKQVQGSSFSKVLNYVHHKSGARGIGSNMIGKDPKILTEEFKIASSLRPGVTKCVYHVSLSVSPNERLSDSQWFNIARTYLKGMDFNGNQYAVYRHTDTQHDHVHIIANRVRITDGSPVSDSWQYRKGEIVVRRLEEQFNLSPTSSGFNRRKTSPSTGEMRRYKRTGEVIPRCELQRLIDEALSRNPSLEEFIDNLRERSVSVRLRQSDGGEIEGISYKLNGVAFQGRQLGRDYSWNGIKAVFATEKIAQSPKEKIEAESLITSLAEVSEDELQRRKIMLSKKYNNIANYIRNFTKFDDGQVEDIDMGVMALSLKSGDSLNEAKMLLTSSDRVQRWREELPREVFINVSQQYIESIADRVIKSLDKDNFEKD